MSSLRQRLNVTGIGYAGLDGVWWRPALAPFSLPLSVRTELAEAGQALFALFDAVADLVQDGASERLQHLLTYKVPASLQRLVGSERVLAVRPDFQLCPTAEGGYRPVATELEICPSAQGFAHAMQVAYGLNPDLAEETARLLAGRSLLIVGAQSWSPFLFEQLAFCRALEEHGAEGRVLYDRPLTLLDEEVRAGSRWRPPLFGVPERPPGWQQALLSRLRDSGLERYWWPEDACWPGMVDDAVVFRFGYLNLFQRQAADDLLAVTKPEAALPEVYAEYRPVVRDGIRFLFSHLSVPRLIGLISDQAQLPRETPIPERIVRMVPSVEKVRLVKQHKKQVQGQAQGGIVEAEAPIHVSNVKLVSKGNRASGQS